MKLTSKSIFDSEVLESRALTITSTTSFFISSSMSVSYNQKSNIISFTFAKPQSIIFNYKIKHGSNVIL